jgi:branched-chain amino acid transport system permease protein
VIVSMGVMFIMNGLVRFIIGPTTSALPMANASSSPRATFREMTGLRRGWPSAPRQGITIVTAVIVVALLFWFLNRTRTGKSMRAFSDNEDLALLSGINPERVVVDHLAHRGGAGDHGGRALRARQVVQALHLFPAAAADLRLGHRRRAGQPAGRHRGRLRDRLFRGDGHLCLQEGAGLPLPEAWSPTGLVQLLSTDYKFAVSFVILMIVLLFRPPACSRGKRYEPPSRDVKNTAAFAWWRR